MRSLADHARDHAHILVEAMVPTGTKRYDEVSLSRQAIENQIARAIVFGYELAAAEVAAHLANLLTPKSSGGAR